MIHRQAAAIFLIVGILISIHPRLFGASYTQPATTSRIEDCVVIHHLYFRCVAFTGSLLFSLLLFCSQYLFSPMPLEACPPMEVETSPLDWRTGESPYIWRRVRRNFGADTCNGSVVGYASAGDSLDNGASSQEPSELWLGDACIFLSNY